MQQPSVRVFLLVGIRVRVGHEVFGGNDCAALAVVGLALEGRSDVFFVVMRLFGNSVLRGFHCRVLNRTGGVVSLAHAYLLPEFGVTWTSWLVRFCKETSVSVMNRVVRVMRCAD